MNQNLTNEHRKRQYARSIFSIVASSYQKATRILSFGTDSRLKKKCIRMLDTTLDGVILDLATGDGDFIPLLRQHCPRASIIGYDLTMAMLSRAKNMAEKSGKCLLVQGDMMVPGIKSESIQAITGGYALRNAPDLRETINQMYRMLTPGGVAVFLEFTRSPNPAMSFLQIALLRLWCGLWGVIFHGKSNVYGYIADTVRLYPDRHSIHEMFRELDFDIVRSEVFMTGFLEILTVKKSGKSELIS